MHAGEHRFRASLLLPALGAVLLTTASAPAAQPDSRADNLLRHRFGLSAADLRALDRGVAVTRTLDTPVRQELAHVGAVHIDAPIVRFLQRFRDIERFERGPGVPQIGRFGTPPQLGDLAFLTLPAADLEALAICRPGSCDVQLPAAVIRRFQHEVDWSSAHAAGQANQVAREVLLGLVRAYQADGNAALGHYDDGGEPLPVAEQFRALLASSEGVPVPIAGLLAHLDGSGRHLPAGAEDFMYWSVVDFGLKPTIRVNHVIIYPLAGRPSGVAYAVAIKQLYASHYFHTTLELRFLVADDRPDGRGFWLLSITRSRNDGMTGFKGVFLRPIITRRSGAAVRGYLEHVKRQVERVVLPDAPRR